MFVEKNKTAIPDIESIDSLSLQELDMIRSTGFCYVKIPSTEMFANHSSTLQRKAIDLFRSSEENKSLFTFRKKSGKQIDKFLISGYTDRRSKAENLETYRQDMNDNLNPPFQDVPEAIADMKATLVKHIAVGLSKKILNSLKIDRKALNIYDSALENPVAVLTFTYYPAMSAIQRLSAPPGINPHRDIDLLTVLLLEKPGLEAWVDGEWLPLLPKSGYALVIFGDDFATLTKGQVRSCLHVVRSTGGEERLSMVSFVSMDRTLPFVLTDGTVLANTGAEYLDKRYYQHNIGIKLHAKSAFSNIKNKVNLSYLLISSLFAIRSLIGISSESQLLSYSSQSSRLFLSSIAGFSLINGLLKVFSQTYFDRMILDILQYSEEPNFATKEKLQAYNLGKQSLSLSGMTSSFFNSATYAHRSYWNAGFLSVFSEQFSDKESVRRDVEQKISAIK